MKKIFIRSLLLCCILLAFIPMLCTAKAVEENHLASGICGENLTWTLDSDGKLTISGSGAMEYTHFASEVPWNSWREFIVSTVVEEGVTEIPNYAFYNCTNLRSIIIPNSVTKIGDDAFCNCTSLNGISIPNSVTQIGAEAFFNCANLSSIIIPQGVTQIDPYTFGNCTNLSNISIPDSISKIYFYAFVNCIKLRRVDIMDIAAWCNTDFDGDYSNPLYYASNGLYLNGEPITSVELPDGITSIPHYAFCFCSSLSSITLPKSISDIGDWVFYDCESLIDVTIPDSVTKIGSGAFSNCSSLTTVHYSGTEKQKANISLDIENEWLMDATWHYECNGVNCQEPETHPTEPEESQPVGIPFTDVAEDAYYAAPVLWAMEKGITNGIDAAHFGPDAGCTRAHVVTFLWRAAGSPAPSSSYNPFTDVVPGAYYYDAVLWAVEKGITNGTSATTFAPDQTCTRGQIVTFLWRYQHSPSAAGMTSFNDVPAGQYYSSAVAWAVENAITNGMGEGIFAPDATCTRGQIVTFLYRAMAK